MTGVSTRRPVLHALRRIGSLDVVVALSVVLIAALILYPVGALLHAVLAGSGSFGGADAARVLADPVLPATLANTAILVGASGFLALVIGAALAWLNERTDARMGWVSDIVPVIPLLVPPVAGAIGWVFLLAPRAGFLNVAFRYIFRSPTEAATTEGPIDIYNVAGLIFVTTLFLLPYVYMTASAALRDLDPSLEEASRVSGAGSLKTLVAVTLPAIRQALASSAVLVLMAGLALFTVPAVIGTQARFDVLSTLIYRALFGSFPPRFDEALVLSVFMLFAIQIGVSAEYLITRSGRHATIGGRSRAPTTSTRLGGWRWPTRLSALLYFALATLLPLSGLVLVSLQGFWSPNIRWERLSLANFSGFLVEDTTARRALVNSFVVAVLAATIAMALAALLTSFVRRARGFLGQLVNSLSTLPATVPHTVIGVGFLVATASSQLNHTLVILLLAYLVLLMPQASRTAAAAISKVGLELAEASLICGASPLRTLLRIALPLMLGGLVAGWAIVFVLGFGEVTASVFLSGSANPVIGPLLLDLWTNGIGTYPQVAALALVMAVVNTAMVLSVLRLARGASLSSRLG